MGMLVWGYVKVVGGRSGVMVVRLVWGGGNAVWGVKAWVVVKGRWRGGGDVAFCEYLKA